MLPWLGPDCLCLNPKHCYGRSCIKGLICSFLSPCCLRLPGLQLCMQGHMHYAHLLSIPHGRGMVQHHTYHENCVHTGVHVHWQSVSTVPATVKGGSWQCHQPIAAAGSDWQLCIRLGCHQGTSAKEQCEKQHAVYAKTWQAECCWWQMKLELLCWGNSDIGIMYYYLYVVAAWDIVCSVALHHASYCKHEHALQPFRQIKEIFTGPLAWNMYCIAIMLLTGLPKF